MAEIMTQHDREEAEFRRKRQWTSFKAQVYTGLSTATFFSVLVAVVSSAITAVSASATAANAAAMFGPAPLALAGAALVAGTIFTYLAQNEWTDMRVLEDDHLAKRNAECMQQKSQSPEKGCAVEYEQNCRPDGKQWAQVVETQKAQVQSHAIH